MSQTMRAITTAVLDKAVRDERITSLERKFVKNHWAHTDMMMRNPYRPATYSIFVRNEERAREITERAFTK